MIVKRESRITAQLNVDSKIMFYCFPCSQKVSYAHQGEVCNFTKNKHHSRFHSKILLTFQFFLIYYFKIYKRLFSRSSSQQLPLSIVKVNSKQGEALIKKLKKSHHGLLKIRPYMSHFRKNCKRLVFSINVKYCFFFKKKPKIVETQV